MGLLTLLFRLPFLPLKGFIHLAELIDEQTQRELRDPARVRRELEEAQWRHAQGEISDEEVSRIEHKAISTLVTTNPAAPSPADDRS